jgi:hypothetical protein
VSVASFRFPFDINIWRVSHCKARAHHKFTRDRVSRPRASVKSVSEPRTVVTSICDTLASKSIFIQFHSPCNKYTHTFSSLFLLTAARIQSKSARTCVRRQVTRRKEGTATDMSSGLVATIGIVGISLHKAGKVGDRIQFQMSPARFLVTFSKIRHSWPWLHKNPYLIFYCQ